MAPKGFIFMEAFVYYQNENCLSFSVESVLQNKTEEFVSNESINY